MWSIRDIPGSSMIGLIIEEIHMSRLVIGKFRTVELIENVASYEY